MSSINQLTEKLDQYIDEQLTENEPVFTILFQTSYEKKVDEYVLEKREKETFSVLLNRLREEKGLTPKELYKRAWVDRRLYSQIMGKRNYQPAKNTVIAFGLGLHLSRSEMELLLGSAGISINKSSEFDLVILFCIENKLFDINTVNHLLLHRKQSLLR